MKEPKHKSKAAVADHADDLFDKSVDELADAVVDDHKGHHKSDVEPFEVYAQKVRSKIHLNAAIFRKRFSKGYHVLLEELSKQQPKASRKKDLPPDAIKP